MICSVYMLQGSVFNIYRLSSVSDDDDSVDEDEKSDDDSEESEESEEEVQQPVKIKFIRGTWCSQFLPRIDLKRV